MKKKNLEKVEKKWVIKKMENLFIIFLQKSARKFSSWGRGGGKLTKRGGGGNLTKHLFCFTVNRNEHQKLIQTTEELPFS